MSVAAEGPAGDGADEGLVVGQRLNEVGDELLQVRDHALHAALGDSPQGQNGGLLSGEEGRGIGARAGVRRVQSSPSPASCERTGSASAAAAALARGRCGRHWTAHPGLRQSTCGDSSRRVLPSSGRRHHCRCRSPPRPCRPGPPPRGSWACGTGDGCQTLCPEHSHPQYLPAVNF